MRICVSLPSTVSKSDKAARIRDHSVPVGRTEAEAGESPEANGPFSLKFMAENSKETYHKQRGT